MTKTAIAPGASGASVLAAVAAAATAHAEAAAPEVAETAPEPEAAAPAQEAAVGLDAATALDLVGAAYPAMAAKLAPLAAHCRAGVATEASFGKELISQLSAGAASATGVAAPAKPLATAAPHEMKPPEKTSASASEIPPAASIYAERNQAMGVR